MVKNLIKFLHKKDWIELKKDQLADYYQAPENLNFEDRFVVRIPINKKIIDYKQHRDQILKTISEIYNYSYGDFLKIIFDTSILRFTLKNNSDKGSYPLSDFNIFDNTLRSTLLDTASFVIKPEYEMFEIQKEAEIYYQKCKFLTPETGSFVVRIEVQPDKIIKKDLFHDEVTTSDINDRLFNIMEFLNINILKNEDQSIYDDNFLITHKQYFNKNVLKDFTKLYSTTKTLELNYANPLKSVVTIANEVEKKELDNINDFIKIVDHNNPFDENIIDIFCENALIIDLASNDPTEDNNTITLKGKVYNIDSVIKIKLDSQDYKKAIDAHKNKKFISVKGKGEKLKSYYRIDNLKMLSL